MGRVDPMVSVLADGLPAVARLKSVIAEQTGAHTGVELAEVEGPDQGLVPLHEDMVSVPDEMALAQAPESSDELQRFSPGATTDRHDHSKRRGFIVAAMLAVALLILAIGAENLLLNAPLSAAGVIEPTSSAQLNMSQTGAIATIPVSVGETVHAGQVLATQDTTADQAKLAADQSKLSADLSTLAQEKAGPAGVQTEQLRAQVTSAETDVSAAQAKLSQASTTSDAAVAAAGQQVQSDQSLLASDQAANQAQIPQCLGATPPPACATDARQVALDQGKVSADQSAYQVAVANSQSAMSSAQSGASQAEAAVTVAQSALAAAASPSTPQEIATTEAVIQQDQAAISADQTLISQALLTAPFSGVVSAINATVGELASSSGVRLPTSPTSVSQPSTGGIQIFPQTTPQGGSTNSPTEASLIALDSFQSHMVVQVPETDIAQIHVGETATASLPAFTGSSMIVHVTQIQPTPVTTGGKTYFLVDLVSKAGALQLLTKSDGKTASQLGHAQGYTVDVSF